MFVIEILKDIKWKMREFQHRKYYHYSEEQMVKELQDWYYKNLGYRMDMNNPRTFNEKIQWLKLFDSTKEKARLADKLECRQWVAEKIGSKYLIPLIGGDTNHLMKLTFQSYPIRLF